MTIESFIEEYKDFFMATGFDVAHSIKGKWYISAYVEEYDYYDSFVEFETVEELVDILTREWAFLLHCAIEGYTEVPVFDKDILDVVSGYKPRAIDYDELQYNIQTILDSELGNIGMFQYLQKFVTIKKELEQK